MFGGKASADQRKGPHAPSPSQGSNSARRRNHTLRTGLRRTTRQDYARRQGFPNGSRNRIHPPHGGGRERSPLRVRGNTYNRGLGLRIPSPLFTQLRRELCLGELRRITLPKLFGKSEGGPNGVPVGPQEGTKGSRSAASWRQKSTL